MTDRDPNTTREISPVSQPDRTIGLAQQHAPASDVIAPPSNAAAIARPSTIGIALVRAGQLQQL